MRWLTGNPVLAVLGVLAVGTFRAQAATTFMVTSPAAAGDGTLAAAIDAANATEGADVIVFAIADTATPPRIIVSQLPSITAPVTIDGTTQTGGLVELTAAATLAGTGLKIVGGGSTIRGLVINRWKTGIELSGAGGNVIEGNLIGTDPAGTSGRANTEGIVIDGSPDNRIGGAAPAARNLISGNAGIGLRIGGTGATATMIQGNRIGTNLAGANALANQTGISLLDGAGATSVGGTAAGAGNLVSGNGTGIRVGAGADDVIIEGNLVGTDAAGTGAVGNVSEGIRIFGAKRARVGGPAAEARNVISGNGNGVEIEGNTTEDTLVQGNYIGIDAGGSIKLGKTIGVAVIGSLRTRVVGNTISGNLNGINVTVTSAAADLRIESNRIGTDATGAVGVPNTTGILLASGTAIVVGGPEPAAGNVISGNAGVGIVTSATATGALIRQNRIGTAADGLTALGNGTDGVRFGGSGNTVRANVIAFNGAAGVAVTAGLANAVRENAIFDNAKLGIDLGLTGVTANDATDGDTGPNNLQNFPVLDPPLIGGSSVAGTLRSRSGSEYTIDVFADVACDATMHGEGRELVGTGTAATDTAGVAGFTIPVGRPLTTEVLTATATDAAGNTSEFSACVVPVEVVTTTTVTTTSTTTATAEGSTSTTVTSTTLDTTPSSTTASTTSTSTSSIASTSSTVSTTSTLATSPTTTVPLPVGCAIVPTGPTFPSLRCRLDGLRGVTEAESTLGARRVRLLAALARARALATEADDACTAGRRKTPKARLAQTRRSLARYRRSLRLLAARHHDLATTAGPLADAAGALRDDVRTLRRALSCGAEDGAS